jgi:hypothetical protein
MALFWFFSFFCFIVFRLLDFLCLFMIWIVNDLFLYPFLLHPLTSSSNSSSSSSSSDCARFVGCFIYMYRSAKHSSYFTDCTKASTLNSLSPSSSLSSIYLLLFIFVDLLYKERVKLAEKEKVKYFDMIFIIKKKKKLKKKVTYIFDYILLSLSLSWCNNHSLSFFYITWNLKLPVPALV